MNSKSQISTGLSDRDQAVVWHPFTQMKTASPPLGIVSGEGAELTDESGRRIIDGVSSWWVNLHGHANPYIAERVSAQLRKLEHVIFAGFTHEPAVELAERLLQQLPSQQSCVFYSDNGSTAVEVALKMALQYWFNQGINRRKIIAFENAYHGDTFGGMSVSARDTFNLPFQPLLFDTVFIPPPLPGKEEASLSALQEHLGRENAAAFIFEPLVQGVSGMQMYSPEALDKLIELCMSHNVIPVADEVMTGFGRTGRMFASDYLKHKPQIICLSKGLTGGTMALGATTCEKFIYDAFLSEDNSKTFFHGHSYTANPLACTAGLASLDLLTSEECRSDIKRIIERHGKFSRRLREHPVFRNVRQQGTILAAEIRDDAGQSSYFSKVRDKLYDFFIERGVLLRPLGNIVYIMPPYCITDSQLDIIYDAIIEFGDLYNEEAGR